MLCQSLVQKCSCKFISHLVSGRKVSRNRMLQTKCLSDGLTASETLFPMVKSRGLCLTISVNFSLSPFSFFTTSVAFCVYNQVQHNLYFHGEAVWKYATRTVHRVKMTIMHKKTKFFMRDRVDIRTQPEGRYSKVKTNIRGKNS